MPSTACLVTHWQLCPGTASPDSARSSPPTKAGGSYSIWKTALYETRRVKQGPRRGVSFSIGLKLQNFAVWPAAQSPECTRVVHYAVYVDVHTYRHILHFLFHTATIQTQLSFYFCIVSKPRLRCQSNRCPQAPSLRQDTKHMYKN